MNEETQGQITFTPDTHTGIYATSKAEICLTTNSRKLLTIHADGTVTGEIEDASEAGRVFVESIRYYLNVNKADQNA